MNLWLSLNAGFTIKSYHVELSVNAFDWLFKYKLDKHRGIYLLYVGPFGIHISDDKRIEEFLSSIKIINEREYRETARIYEEAGPDGQPLN